MPSANPYDTEAACMKSYDTWLPVLLLRVLLYVLCTPAQMLMAGRRWGIQSC